MQKSGSVKLDCTNTKHTLSFLVSAIATKDGNKGPTYDRYGLHGNTPQEKKKSPR